MDEQQDLTSHIRHAIEVRPEDPDEVIANTVVATTGEHPTPHRVAQVRAQLRLEWNRHWRTKTEEERERYHCIREWWVNRFIDAWHERKEGALPTYKILRAYGVQVFGGSLQDRVLSTLRIQREIIRQGRPDGASRVQVRTKEGEIIFRKLQEVRASDTFHAPEGGLMFAWDVAKKEPLPPEKGEDKDALIADLRARVTALAKERDDFEEALGKLQVSYEIRNGQAKEAKGLRKENADLKEQVRDLRRQVSALQMERGDLTVQVGLAKTEARNLQNQLEATTEERDNHALLADELERQIDSLKKKLDQKNLTLDDLIRMGCTVSVTPPAP